MSKFDRHIIVKEIYQDRQKFSEKVFEVASSDLINMGIAVVSYTIKDIRDEMVNFTIFIQKIEFLQSLLIRFRLFSFRVNVVGEHEPVVCLLQGYLMALGMKRTAEVKKDARIGEAVATKERQIRVINSFILILGLSYCTRPKTYRRNSSKCTNRRSRSKLPTRHEGCADVVCRFISHYFS